LLPVDVLLTKATGEGFTTKAHGTFWKSVEREFEGGGWVMWPIFGLGTVGLLITLLKSFVFVSRDQMARRLAAQVQTLAADGRVEEARQLCRKAKGSVGRVLASVLENAGATREDAESRAHEVMLHESPALEKYITTMNILAAASPLVGLLGTVTGMVNLFDVITVHGTGNPKLMAGGISEALIATKWGLGVAIPLLLAYNLLDNWSGRVIANMEKYAARLVNTLFPAHKRVTEHA
jgi:biopolymer transport protein ExbB